MTQPRLATPVRKMGRMYPYPPRDLSDIKRNQWGSVNPEDVPDGILMLPSVTNILGVIDKPALKPWYAGMALADAFECQCLKSGVMAIHHDFCDCTTKRCSKGHCKPDCGEAEDHFLRAHRTAADRRKNERADEGTRAHTIAEALTSDLPLPASVSEADEQYADAFMAWFSDHEPDVQHTESTVAWLDPTRPSSGYAGTADGFAHFKTIPNSGLVVYDFKTSGKLPDDKAIARFGLGYTEQYVQLAALGSAMWRYFATPDGWEADILPVVTHGMLVYLYPNGEYRTQVSPPESMTADHIGFVSLLTWWRRVNNLNMMPMNAEVPW